MWLKTSLLILWVATCALYRISEAASINTCGPEASKCGDGSCIPKDKLCNGKEDCPRGEDERYCTVAEAAMASSSMSPRWSCRYDEFTCYDGECIPLIWKCDGYLDCRSGEDEFYCGESTTEWWPETSSSSCRWDEFTCYDGKCIPSQYRCDGYRDCLHGEDEYNCGYTDHTTRDPYPMTTRDPYPMTTRDPVVECSHPFDVIGGKCILIDPVVEGTWHESRYLCQRIDADLVVLDTLESYGELVRFLKETELTARDYWVGASDEAIEGQWMWVNYQKVRNGTPLWALYGSGSSYYQEPRWEYASSQDCGYLDQKRFYYMDDSDCNEKKALICEKTIPHYEATISEDEMSGGKILEVLESSQKEQDATGVHSNFIQKTQDTQSHKSSPENSPVEEKKVEGNNSQENNKENLVQEALPNKHVETVIKEMQEKFLLSGLGKNVNQP